MTDDQMNAQLREAGERWRGANTATTDRGSDELVFAPSAQSHHRRWLTLASAAVIAAALVIGGVVWATQQRHTAAPPASNSSISQLEGVTWTDPASGSTIVFLNGAARYTVGCATEVRALRLVGDHFTLIGKMGATGTCSPPTHEPDQTATDHFDTVAQGPSTWSMIGRTLKLTTLQGASVTLTTDGRPAPSIASGTWVLERVDNSNIGSYIDAHLTFDGSGGFTANDLCNDIRGRASSTLRSIVFRDVTSTTNPCPPPAPATAEIDKMLSGPTHYYINGNELFLSTLDNQRRLVYRFHPSNTVKTAVTLTGQTWNLTSVQFGDDVFAQPRKPVMQSHLTFLGGSYEATHRCYTRAGASNIGDGSMTLIGSRAIDTLPCPQIPNSALNTADGQESQAVDAILDGTVQWTRRGTTLTLHKDGAGTLVYTSTGTGTSTAAAKFSGAIWRLVTIESGPTATTPSGRIFLQRLAGTIAVNGCASPGIGFIKLSNGRLTVSNFRYSSPCENPLLSSANRAALSTILSGQLTWSITGNQLTITKHGVGSLRLVRK